MLRKFLSLLDKKSIVFRWLLSYFVLIAVFMLSMGVSLGYYYNTFKNETLRTNEYIADVAAEEFNGIFSRSGLIIHGATDSTMRSLIVNDLDNNKNKEYVYSLIKKALNMIVGNNNDFEQCFFYLEDHDVIIGTTSLLDSKTFYDVYFKKTGTSYEKWLKSISSDTQNSFVPLGKNSDRKYILVNKNAFSMIYRLNTVSLIFVLDNSSIDEMNQRILDTSGAYLVMEDNKGNFINFSSNSDFDDITRDNIYERKNVEYLKTKAGENIVLSKTISENNILRLIIPKKIFNNKLAEILIIQIVMLLFIILISVILSVVFSKIHFSPVKAMLSALNAKNSDSQENEYSVISKIISDVQSEKKSMDMTITRQETKLKNTFIRGLLRGENDAISSAAENFRIYKMDFSEENYAVLIFEIADYEDSWKAYSHSEADYDTLRFALENIVNELVGQKYACCTVNMFDGVVCIANIPSGITEENYRNEISELYMYVKKYMFEKLGFSFRMVGGSIKKTPGEIKLSYGEAVSCLEYNMVYDKKIMFMDSSEIHSFRELNAFFGKTARLVKLMRQGSETDLEPAVDEWAKMYVSLSASFPDIMQYEISGLINSILRDIFSQSSDGADAKEFAEKITSQYKPKARIGYLEIKETLMALSADIREFLNGNADGADYLEKRVMRYIEDNYTDTNLNVAKIAESLKMNSAYLSSAFKKTANVGVLERLNKFRCEKSTTLLSETDRNINEIALEVGYSSVHTYIRIFKKYFFMTPTQYRSEIRRGKNE